MAEIKVYKMFNATAVGGDAVASYDVQEDGDICSILLDISVTGADALNDGVRSELSFSSVSGFLSNDTRASLIGAAAYQGFLTSGGGQVGKNTFITFAPFGIPVAAGERLYLHTAVTGTITLAVSVWVYHCLGRPGGPRARVGRRVR